MGPSLHESYTDAFWLNETAVCGCHQETWLCACCWSVSLSLGVDLTLLPVHYLLTRAAGGWRGAAAHRNCWAGQIKSVDGSVPFRLSYFDCSNLHLFSIFTREDTDPPPPYKARAFDSCDNAAPSPLPPPSSWQKNLLRPCLLASKKTCNVPVPWRLESHKL